MKTKCALIYSVCSVAWLLSLDLYAQTLTITFTSSTVAEWYYVSDKASTVAEWYYFTDGPSKVAKWVYFTSTPSSANVLLTSERRKDTTWLYISDSPSTVADWIYISDTPSTVAEWVYIADSPKAADVLIYTDDPSLKTPRVVACVLEYLKKKTKRDEGGMSARGHR